MTAAVETTVSPTARGGGGPVRDSASDRAVKKPPRGEGVFWSRRDWRSFRSRSRDECYHNLGSAVLRLPFGGGVVERRVGGAAGGGRDAAGVDPVAGDQIVLGGLGPAGAELHVGLL